MQALQDSTAMGFGSHGKSHLEPWDSGIPWGSILKCGLLSNLGGFQGHGYPKSAKIRINESIFGLKPMVEMGSVVLRKPPVNRLCRSDMELHTQGKKWTLDTQMPQMDD